MTQTIAKIHGFVELGKGFAVMAVAVFAAGCQTEETSEVFRGSKLRTEVVREETTPYLTVELLDANQKDEVAFEIEHRQVVRVHERDIHQKMHVFADPDDINRERYRYVPVPDEEISGETKVRIEKRRVGPLANDRVRCRDVWHNTDSDGIVKIDLEQLLRPFDDSGRKQYRLEFFHSDFGAAEKTVRRDKLLAALGIDLAGNPRQGSDASGLNLEMSYPESATTGSKVTFRLHARNNGGKHVYGVRARIFSHADWLDGINFYIGHLSPEGSQHFQRTVEVPTDQPKESVFAQLGVRHAEGALEKSAQKIILQIK